MTLGKGRGGSQTAASRTVTVSVKCSQLSVKVDGTSLPPTEKLTGEAAQVPSKQGSDPCRHHPAGTASPPQGWRSFPGGGGLVSSGRPHYGRSTNSTPGLRSP